eukprot:4634134-Amphidinium_carterae.1
MVWPLHAHFMKVTGTKGTIRLQRDVAGTNSGGGIDICTLVLFATYIFAVGVIAEGMPPVYVE